MVNYIPAQNESLATQVVDVASAYVTTRPARAASRGRASSRGRPTAGRARSKSRTRSSTTTTDTVTNTDEEQGKNSFIANFESMTNDAIDTDEALPSSPRSTRSKSRSRSNEQEGTASSRRSRSKSRSRRSSSRDSTSGDEYGGGGGGGRYSSSGDESIPGNQRRVTRIRVKSKNGKSIDPEMARRLVAEKLSRKDRTPKQETAEDCWSPKRQL